MSVGQIISNTPDMVLVNANAISHRIDPNPFRPKYIDSDILLDGFPKVEKLGHLLLKGKNGLSGGATPLGANYKKHGIRFIRTGEVNDCWIDGSECVFISKEDDNAIKRSRLSSGDVLLTITGACFGKSAVVPKELLPANISQHSVRIRTIGDLNTYFLVAYLNCSTGQLQIFKQTVGSTRQAIDYIGIQEIRIPIPDRRVQDFIGAKVKQAERYRTEALKVWNEALSLLSKAIGIPMNEETFVPSNPQDVSASGYSVASVKPAIVQVSNTRIKGYIGAQFFHPRRAKALIIIEQSGLGTKRLSDLANRLAERIPATDFYEHRYPYFGLANIDSTFGFIDGEGSDDISGTCALFRAGDILFSKLRPYLNKVTICPEHVPQACGSTELVVYRAKKGIDPYFLFFILKSPLVLNQVINITSGSTHPRVDPELIDEVLIPIPGEPIRFSIGENARKTLKLLYIASRLVDEAKSDVQSLIEGTLDTDSIITGKLKPISQKDISDILNKEILQ